MSIRNVKSPAAAAVQLLLSSRNERDQLHAHGWSEDVPIILAHPTELIDDVLLRVGLQNHAVVVALLDEATQLVELVHLSRPDQALERVVEVSSTGYITELFDQVRTAKCMTLRAKYWQHSAVAHWIPRENEQ